MHPGLPSLFLSVVFEVEQASCVDADREFLVHQEVHSEWLEVDCCGTVAMCGSEPCSLLLHLPPTGERGQDR